MGNSASKKALLEAAQKNYADAAASLTTRDQELDRTQKDLQASKAQETKLSDESETLRKKYADLDALSKSLEQERQSHIAKLQAELKMKGDEILGQKRVIEARTQERDEARKGVAQMDELVKVLEQKSLTSNQEFDQRRKEMEDSAQLRDAELNTARDESRSLLEKVRLLEERYEVLSTDFASAKSLAEEKLAAAKTASAEEVSVARANATKELETAKASMSDSARNLASVSSELASTKAALSASTAKYGDLQRTHNESVSRRAASYEAFTATKQELLETQQKYITLNQSHEKQGLDIEGAKKELRDERETNDRLRAELAVLQARLADSERLNTRKPIPEIKIQEVTVA